MSSVLRDYLAEELAKAVRQAGVVVWQDDSREYRSVAQSICPREASFAAFDGSWYQLRHEVEGLLASDKPPQLVVYASASAPAEDPLAEIRAAGKDFKRRLSTVVRQAFAGQLAAGRVEQIAREATTLEEAETVAGGVDAADVRLVGILGTADSILMALAVLDGTKDEVIDAEGVWGDVARMLSETFGGSISGEGSELRESVTRQAVLADIANAAGDLPSGLSAAWVPPTAAQQRRTEDLLRLWRYSPQWNNGYRKLVADVDKQLDLATALPWHDGLSTCFTAPSVEAACAKEAIRRLGQGDYAGALVLAEERLLDANPWRDERTGSSSSRWSDHWRVIKAVGVIHRAIAEHTIPTGELPALLNWYIESGFGVDRAHRRLELSRMALASYGDLEQHVTAARSAYEQWVDKLCQAATAALSKKGLDGVSQLPQGEIHERHVKGIDGLTAYIWVDALRYELGVELAEAIRHDITEHVSLHAATAGAPTITRVGMVNLAPSAAETLTLGLDRGKLSVAIAGREVSTVEHRVELLRAAHGAVVNLDLGALSQQGEKELARAIKGADFVLVRSQEIDASGESGLLNTAWPQFESTKQDLANAVAKLGQAGVRRIVITADHGFLAMSQSVGDPRTIDAPIGGEGELHRRCWVGKGGTTADGTTRVPLVALGIRSDLDLIVPKGLAVFKAGGGKQFFHGGLSPQELIIPVIVVDLEAAQEPQKLDIDVSVAGGRIATGVFAATVKFHGDLFTDSVTFRVVVRGIEGSDPIARVVSGDGYDPESGSVTVTQDRPSVLTFQVVSNLDRDTQVELQVLDARTGRRLATSVAEVAAPVVVEEEL